MRVRKAPSDMLGAALQRCSYCARGKQLTPPTAPRPAGFREDRSRNLCGGDNDVEPSIALELGDQGESLDLRCDTTGLQQRDQKAWCSLRCHSGSDVLRHRGLNTTVRDPRLAIPG